jgi:SAM-dependent methyltransferase
MSMKGTSSHSYDSLFYRYQREGACESALRTLPLLLNVLSIGSVLDIGCGAGAWLAAYRQLGVPDLLGVDGDYVDRSLLMMDVAHFRAFDIAAPFDLGRRFDIVQCLEVAEHVSPHSSSVLLDNIVRHGNQVLFSAAVPGQGGENHVNERPYAYWRAMFSARGFRLFDFMRGRMSPIPSIEPWYRYNTLFFAHDSIVNRLPYEVLVSRVGEGEPIRDVSPLHYRLRKAALRTLPQPVISGLSILKHRRAVRALKCR